MTIAVTGATGFLGPALCATLAEQGHAVRAFTRSGSAPVRGVEPVRLVDLDDRAGLQLGCAEVDAVVHLAARAHVMRDTVVDPEAEYMHVNVVGTRNVLEAATAGGARHVVLLSSVKAIGESNLAPWTEDHPAAPVDAYGRSKLHAEQEALDFARRGLIRVSVLRLPLVYGPGARANVFRLLSLVERGWPLPLGSIRNRRSMIYLENAVAAIAALLFAPSQASGVYFASDGRDVSTPELVRMIAGALGKPARLLPLSPALLQAAGRVGDQLRRVVRFPLSSAEIERLTGTLALDTTRLAATTGFRPPVTVEEGWRRTAEWFKSRQETS